MKRLRYYLLLLSAVPYTLYLALPLSRYALRHKDKVDLRARTRLSYRIINHMRILSHTKTEVYGYSNIPEDQGVIFYSNHQGKYDALGILYALKDRPCSVLWDAKAANRVLAREICGLIDAVCIDLSTNRGKVIGINRATEMIAKKRDMLIFPEGGYEDNKNRLQPFFSGCFRCALKTEADVVPVAIYDSWRALNSNYLGFVKTQVHFLEPIHYEDYKDLTKKELSDLVESRIAGKIREIDNEKKRKKNKEAKDAQDKSEETA